MSRENQCRPHSSVVTNAPPASFLIDLASTAVLGLTWKNLPNIRYSLALATFHLDRLDDAKANLKEAITLFPWIIPKLYHVLNINLPAAFKAITPPTSEDTLLSEVYCYRCADLWNIPEATELLTSVVNSISALKGHPQSTKSYFTPTRWLNIARHVILTDVRELIVLLPKALTSDPGMAFDPLPPPDGISSYQREAESAPPSTAATATQASSATVGVVTAFFRSLLPTFVPGDTPINPQVITELANQVDHLPPAQQVDFMNQLRAEMAAQADQRGEGVVDTDVVEQPAMPESRQPTVESDNEEDEEKEDSPAVQRLVQILQSGRPENLQARVDRMFEGQGEEMADVRRRVEERLGLR